MTGRCNECKYSRIIKGTWGIVFKGLLRCDCDKFIYVGELEEDLYHPTTPPIDSLVYGDYEGYAASFHVAPHFGCVHFTSFKGKDTT